MQENKTRQQDDEKLLTKGPITRIMAKVLQEE